MMPSFAEIAVSIDPWLFTFFTQEPLWLRLLVMGGVGLLLGRLLVLWIPRMDLPENIWQKRDDPAQRRIRSRAAWAVQLVTGMLLAGLVFCVIDLKCQATPEEGSGFLIHWRIVFQSLLLVLLVAATVVDLEMYLIPDAITLTGAVIGVGMATAVGQTQLVPLWVDWNQAVPGLAGPYIPGWIQDHPHLHGLAWSLTGLVVGAGITWGVRSLASLLMGREALGFGDVTLMGMIGSFVGWQAIIFVFLLAPLCGIFVGLAVRMLTGRTYVPYGPYLSLAAVIVLFTWTWIWTPTHKIFGDITLLVILTGVSLAGLVVLLGASRLYWLIPVSGVSRGEEPAPERETPTDDTSSTDAG